MTTIKNSVPRNKGYRLGAALLGIGLGASPAFATGEFDFTATSATFTSGIGAVSILVGSVAALATGVIVYIKLKRYFNKAG